jgi:hypothetical protein
VIGARIREGIVAGLVAAAATAGALVGFGRAHGSAWAPLAAIAHMIAGPRATSAAPTPGLILAGVMIHAISLLVWGILFALLVGRLRGWLLLLASLCFTGLACVVDYVIVPVRLRPGFELVVTRGELAVVYVVLALGLALGLAVGRRWVATAVVRDVA